MEPDRKVEDKPEKEKISLYGYLSILIGYRRFILLNFLGVCVAVAVLSLFLPSWYTANTSILPPQRGGLGLGLGLGIASSLAGGTSEFGTSMSLPLMASPSDVIAAILKSQTVALAVIEKEDLMKTYHTKTKEGALKEVFSHTQVKVTPEGIISLSFEDKDRLKAAGVANRFVEELDRVNRETNTSQAKNARIFIEERLAQTKKDLTKAEENLRKFQEENKAVSLDEQMKASIEEAANLKAQMVATEIELNLLRKTMSPSNSQIQELQSKINEIKRQLDIWELGNPKEKSEEKKILDIPFSQVPALSLELARLLREVKIQSGIFELLTNQYEQYKIQETKDTPTIQVLDKAFPPERRSKPKRALLVGLAGIVSLFTSVVFVFGLEYFKKSKERNPEEIERIQTLLGAWRRDTEDLKKKISFKRKKNSS
jgi:tyrosine-protein kinase Etk/Wzc